MPRNTHHRGRSLRNTHKKTSGGLHRTMPSRTKRFPKRRS